MHPNAASHIAPCPPPEGAACQCLALLTAFAPFRLVQLCRDGSDMGICKAAWKVVYTTIKHHPGTVEVLIANKVRCRNPSGPCIENARRAQCLWCSSKTISAWSNYSIAYQLGRIIRQSSMVCIILPRYH